MNGILDRVARSSSAAQYSQFRPTSQREFFALRLASKLNDTPAARHYADLVELHSEAQCLVAYRRAKANGSQSDRSRSFHEELARLGTRDMNGASHRKLAAIRIERRAVAVAIFSGDHLAYAPLVRQLSSDGDKAASSSAMFIGQVLEKCPFETAALEIISWKGEVQRTHLDESITGVLAEQGVSLWQVPKKEILGAFGQPPLRFRRQVREIVSDIWPGVNGSFGGPLIKDALALGLYCQTEYLFNI
jgi:hypothetical protein